MALVEAKVEVVCEVCAWLAPGLVGGVVEIKVVLKDALAGDGADAIKVEVGGDGGVGGAGGIERLVAVGLRRSEIDVCQASSMHYGKEYFESPSKTISNSSSSSKIFVSASFGASLALLAHSASSRLTAGFVPVDPSG